jgi:hypothetical protein
METFLPHPPARVQDGTAYTGNQQYRGNGILRYCAYCKCHKSTGGGRMPLVQGIKQWVCKEHKVNA